ncbi:hypothetical protein KI387_018666, partial [Taxus chinensis]
MSTSHASQLQVQQENQENPTQSISKINYRNPLCPHIHTALKMSSEYQALMEECEFTGLVNMPHFETDPDILNYLLSCYNSED